MSKEERSSLQNLAELVNQLSPGKQQYMLGLVDGIALVKESNDEQTASGKEEETG